MDNLAIRASLKRTSFRYIRGLVRHQPPRSVLLDPDMEKTRSELRIMTIRDNVNLRPAGHDGRIAVLPNIDLSKRNAFVFALAGTETSQKLLLGVGGAAGVRVGQVVGEQAIEFRQIGVDSRISKFAIELRKEFSGAIRGERGRQQNTAASRMRIRRSA
jgi:hypothetical protein